MLRLKKMKDFKGKCPHEQDEHNRQGFHLVTMNITSKKYNTNYSISFTVLMNQKTFRN